MNAKSSEPINTSNTILYIGSDTSYFENIQERFKKSAQGISAKFESIYSPDDKVIQSYVLKLHKDKPRVVIVDFTKSDKALLHLVRVWMRQNSSTRIHFIGLIEQKQFIEVTPKAIMAAIPCVHIKSSEIDSIVFDLLLLGFPDKAQDHGFATARMEDSIHAYYPCKVGIISENSIQIESNIPLTNNQEVTLDTYWSQKRILNSALCKLNTQTQQNLYYNFTYSQRLDFLHAKPFVPDSNMSEDEIKVRSADVDQIVNESKNKISKWIKLNSIDSSPKLLKAYIVDKSSSFFDNKVLTDSHAFVVRSQPFMLDPHDELKAVQPQLIVYNLEEVDEEELELNKDIAHTYNDSRMLQVLVKEVKALFSENPPIILVFNKLGYNTDYLQKTLSYQQIMAVGKEFDSELVLTLANKLKENIVKKLPPPKPGVMYIEKRSACSYAEIETDITFVGCSENDAYFNAQEQIELYTTLKIEHPVPMYITVVETPKFARVQSSYYAIIHSISEEHKKELRRYINTIFFRELEKEKELEQKEMAKAKEAFLEKKRIAAAELAKKALEQEEKDKKKEAEANTDDEESKQE